MELIATTSSGWRRWLKQGFEIGLDWVYPQACVGCGVHLERGSLKDKGRLEYWFCQQCVFELPYHEHGGCSKCGEPFVGVMDERFVCANCSQLDLKFDYAVSAFDFKGAVHDLIHGIKYQNQLANRGALAALIAKAYEQDKRLNEIKKSSHVWVVPAPIHADKLDEREYNQSEKIAERFCQYQGLKMVDFLDKTKSGSAQTKLNRQQRIQNIKNTVQVNQSKMNKLRQCYGEPEWILLIDDVLTTGSTASECARAIRKEMKVNGIVVLTAARS
jgi:ComF family protein